MEEKVLLNEYEFEIFNDFSKKHNPATKHDYFSKIILFKDFIKNKELIEVSKEDCKGFVEFVRGSYAKSTSEKIYSYLHSFYNFMKKQGYIEVNPFKFVEKPQVSRIKTKDDVLSIQEINKLIDSLPRLNMRDRLIMIFLVTTGCLLNELVNLKWKDLMLDEKNNAYVRLGKNKRERVVKLHPYCFSTIESYRAYLGLPEMIIPSDDFVFVSQKRSSITDRNVRIIVKKALDIAGLSNYSAKDFRHSFAAISLRLGAGTEDIKNQLGWSDKYYAIRYKYVINFVDSESIDYIMDSDKMNINKK
ncbi:tyrosine recombinase [[Clostridium] sordellii]|uniref:Tyrosine recombinase n=1 Tax=Paraclostridium sordellii TaxID=1505 RepID=A0A0A1SH30_PARSO|nr:MULTISPECIES: tyrosine-type recombinase/integrase [Paeniclostridium]EPZ58148.1 phage integrase family protein [[Clostridium] sordellii VPI 9048] [Paeniclostridium sordellii VPI 9048]MBW4862357.1 tyrosine-type recombinase/integrase [Paeniclostridium sp.]MBW4874331.1 tyrosine-type recombinase/integrase [Paeniclostridium sp.]MBX9180506.1 tyrosine-type recombinase/integrase [Paeniclostridium sordellii]MCH1965345.1 tyrosine-type recombinase/integrase [Paeniclostridium sordellii]